MRVKCPASLIPGRASPGRVWPGRRRGARGGSRPEDDAWRHWRREGPGRRRGRETRGETVGGLEAAGRSSRTRGRRAREGPRRVSSAEAEPTTEQQRMKSAMIWRIPRYRRKYQESRVREASVVRRTKAGSGRRWERAGCSGLVQGLASLDFR